jgi:hypothetical protein
LFRKLHQLIRDNGELLIYVFFSVLILACD